MRFEPPAPQQVPPTVLAALESVLLDKAAVWGEGCRVRALALRRGHSRAMVLVCTAISWPPAVSNLLLLLLA